MIKKVFLLLLLFTFQVFPQQIDFKSPQNIKLFADYLFCDKDYLRAIDEYENYLNSTKNDTVEFKIALAYYFMDDKNNAVERFNLISKTSPYYELSKMEQLKLLFLQNCDSLFYLTSDKIIQSKSAYGLNAVKLQNIYSLQSNHFSLSEKEFLYPFADEEKIILKEFYNQKINPDYKSETVAGILSTIVPGLGKIYTEEYSDGITAFVLTSLFSYLAYTNFDHKHYTRAWIFTALGAGFYAGNIYGSVASAQIFNAKVNFDFENGIKLFLEKENYFILQYDFCK